MTYEQILAKARKLRGYAGEIQHHDRPAMEDNGYKYEADILGRVHSDLFEAVLALEDRAADVREGNK